MKSITASLMFVGDQAGKAEEAVRRYVSLFANSRLINIEHYGGGEHEWGGINKRRGAFLAQ